MPKTSAIEDYLAGLDDERAAMIEALRAIVRTNVSAMTESIKWNAPSYALDGQDRITLGLERNGGVRLVLHRGAKPRTSTDLSTVDLDGLAVWPSPDRGVIKFASCSEIDARRAELGALCARWIAATR